MIKLMGSLLILTGCGGFGLVLAVSHRREVRMLRKLLQGIQEMAWELKYRMTPLPELCIIAAEAAGGPVGEVLKELSVRLSDNAVTDIAGSMNQILASCDLPGRVRRNVRQLGDSLGRFDMEGQMQGLEIAKRQCRQDLHDLENSGPQRVRSYQTLALCGGAGLAILLL